jgi:hypothetical protein
LVAYVVFKPQYRSADDEHKRDGVDQLKQQLGLQLPEYMLPSMFLALDKLPLTPNGKVDNKALAQLGSNLNLSGSNLGQYVKPQTLLQSSLVDIWQQLLGVERVGIRDNFFELGGHSLLAAQMLSKIRQLHQVELNLSVVFSHQTITLLAEQILMARSTGLPLITKAAPQAHWPLSYAQQTFWLATQVGGSDNSYNMPAALKLKGRLNPQVLQLTYQSLFASHSILRTGFKPGEHGEPIQII